MKFYIWTADDFADECRRDIEYTVVSATSLYFALMTFRDNYPSCQDATLIVSRWRDGREPTTFEQETP